MRPVLLAFVFFSFLQTTCALDCSYKGDPKDKAPFTVKFLTHNTSSVLTQTVCNLFSYITDLELVIGNSNAITEQNYCKELDGIMKKVPIAPVVVFALDTPLQMAPCNYRAQFRSPVLLQITRATRKEGYGLGSNSLVLEIWLDSRFGQLRAGPRVFDKACGKQAPSLASEHLVNSFRLAIHLALQSSDILLGNLNPPLKIVNEEKLNEAWTEYRDEQAKKSGMLNVSWIYALFLLLLTIYSAILVYLPSPDHKVFVDFDYLPETKLDSETGSSSAVSADIKEKLPDQDGYMPLTRFLANNK